MNLIEPTMSLSQPAVFPDQHRDVCLSALRKIWSRQRWILEQDFGFYNLSYLDDEQLTKTMLAEQLALIARAAVGQIDRENESLAGEIDEHIQSFSELLFANALTSTYDIPNSFWDSEIGQMLALAIVWLRRDELISVSEAAELRGVSVQAVSNAVAAGKLRRFINPDEPNPRRRTLVSRKEVEKM